MLGDAEEHRPYEDYAVRHVMGSLDEAESGAFRSHLLDCGECRARVGELRSIASDLAEVERAERREKAARLVETKEREDEPDTDFGDFDEGPSRTIRVLAIAGLLLIVVLSVWNFVLRGQNSGLEGVIDDLQAAAATINLGEPMAVDDVAPRHEGAARVGERGEIAAVVRGTDDDDTYQVNLYDANGSVVDTRVVRSVGGQVSFFGAGPFRTEVTRVELAENRGNGQTIIFRAATD
ncbi:hypothetical protein [Euzebya sp.]|uniref:hypothetical protein n=1 Tax=Euzebya sp. TaxID=1971409 RepID=UPI0035113C58